MMQLHCMLFSDGFFTQELYNYTRCVDRIQYGVTMMRKFISCRPSIDVRKEQLFTVARTHRALLTGS